MPYATKSVGSDIPADLLDLFMLIDGKVHWNAAPRHGRRTSKRAPWGSQAGGKPVIGRGALITVSGYTLLTADVAFALSHAGEWAWQLGSDAPHLPDALDLSHWRSLIRDRLVMLDRAICWRVDRGFTASGPRYAANSPVIGLRLSGFRGGIVTTSGVGILLTDAVHVLEHGRFPFEPQWD